MELKRFPTFGAKVVESLRVGRHKGEPQGIQQLALQSPNGRMVNKRSGAERLEASSHRIRVQGLPGRVGGKTRDRAQIDDRAGR